MLGVLLVCWPPKLIYPAELCLGAFGFEQLEIAFLAVFLMASWSGYCLSGGEAWFLGAACGFGPEAVLGRIGRLGRPRARPDSGSRRKADMYTTETSTLRYWTVTGLQD